MRIPKMRPDTVPNNGPSKGPVRLECRTLEKVIAAWSSWDRINYEDEKARRSAVQMAIKAMLMLLGLLLVFGSVIAGSPV